MTVGLKETTKLAIWANFRPIIGQFFSDKYVSIFADLMNLINNLQVPKKAVRQNWADPTSHTNGDQILLRNAKLT